MRSGRARLAHGWELVRAPGVVESLITRFIRPAVRAVPSAMASRLGLCRIALVLQCDDPACTSQWNDTGTALEISVAAIDTEEHDVALELLLCLGQALWDELSLPERERYWRLLAAEVDDGFPGEIDEQALEAKQRLLATSASARSRRRLQEYGRASFAGTAAEYVHCLWHDVTIRTGPEHLPAPRLRRRLQLLARWFPPDPGYRLFPVVGRVP
jgi:hypothetical protein